MEQQSNEKIESIVVGIRPSLCLAFSASNVERTKPTKEIITETLQD